MQDSIAFWQVDPATYDGGRIDASDQQKPAILFLSGNEDFTHDKAPRNLNQALYSFVEAANIDKEAVNIYIPKLQVKNNGVAVNKWGLVATDNHAKAMVDFLMPETPRTEDALKSALSKITIVGYSHGCEEACALVMEFKNRLSKHFSSDQINEALTSLAIVNIAKSRQYNLPEYAPVPTYTIVSNGDKKAYPLRTARDTWEQDSSAHWKWHGHAGIAHAFEDNHLSVLEMGEPRPITAIKMHPTKEDVLPFSSRIDRPNPEKTSDWELKPAVRHDNDGHHFYLYTNTCRPIPSKNTQVFPSMATAPITLDLIGRWVKESLVATESSPRDASAALSELNQALNTHEYKKSLVTQLDRDQKDYQTIMR